MKLYYCLTLRRVIVKLETSVPSMVYMRFLGDQFTILRKRFSLRVVKIAPVPQACIRSLIVTLVCLSGGTQLGGSKKGWGPDPGGGVSWTRPNCCADCELVDFSVIPAIYDLVLNMEKCSILKMLP